MHFRHLAGPAILAVALQTGSIAVAQKAVKPTPVLSAQDIDPLRLLPPPPAEGSVVQKAEVAELHQIQDSRTEAEFAKAKYDDAHEDAWVFAAVLGPKFDPAALPATARLMAQVHADDAAAAKRAKDAFQRMRPWGFDATIVGCQHGDDKPRTSYPSGHATMGFAAATVLADLAPEHAQALMSFAQAYAHDRLVCGHHFQSDVIAGELLGTIVAVELLHRPELKAEVEAARAELQAAGIR